MCTLVFLSRKTVSCYLFIVFCSFTALAQVSHPPVTSNPPEASNTLREFPVLLERNVVAGKTAVGTKIQAKLSVATLANGTVIPRNAVFTGEVTESVAKTATGSSRLTLCMNSVQWKNGSAVMKAYLTPWYYPTLNEKGQNLQYGPEQPANRTWNGRGEYPDPHSSVHSPFPDNSDSGGSTPDATTSIPSNRRAPMKDVETEPTSEGGITIVSRKANIKLDKMTTYIIATIELQLVLAKPATAK